MGRVGDGEQRLSLGQRCWYKGIVIHELGHAIGFWHEMNRPDRDDWIYVYWQNIIPVSVPRPALYTRSSAAAQRGVRGVEGAAIDEAGVVSRASPRPSRSTSGSPPSASTSTTAPS